MLLFCAPPDGIAEKAGDSGVAEQLQAAKLMQAALAARGATADEWRKLDESYTALIAQNPRDVAVRNARAEFLWDIGDHTRSVAEWQEAEKIDPKNPVILSHLGSGLLTLGDARKSAGYYMRAVESAPQDPTAHFALANVWFLFRHELLDAAHPDAESLLTGALAHFAEASRLAPENAEYARAYAETFYSVPKPDWAAALDAWQTVQRLNPQPDFALLNQARIHLKMSHPDAAKRCLDQIQSPDYQTLRLLLETQANSSTGGHSKVPSSPLDSGASNAP